MNRIEHHFHGESAVHRKMFYMPIVLGVDRYTVQIIKNRNPVPPCRASLSPDVQDLSARLSEREHVIAQLQQRRDTDETDAAAQRRHQGERSDLVREKQALEERVTALK